MRIYRLENTVQAYPWGSGDGLSKALGLPNPGGGPQAELWMGAHPKAPSLALIDGRKQALNALIAEDPDGSLGSACLGRFGPALPFLFKALSAAKPLSIQVHPSKRRAERGYEKENESSLAVDDPTRNYRDPNHKPELAVALTRFEALCGFRPVESIIELLRLLAPAEYLGRLSKLGKSPGRLELSVFFYTLLTVLPEWRGLMLGSVARSLDRLTESDSIPAGEERAFAWVRRLLHLHPNDIGALSPILFNCLELGPGQGIFIGAGEPHAYLEGTALEIMANSDNVIRGALTDKHVDIPELISNLSFDTSGPILIDAVVGDGEERFPVPVPDFSLARVRLPAREMHEAHGPEILLCGEGRAVVESQGDRLTLERGESAFVRADSAGYRLEGGGILWRAGADPAMGSTKP
jgi:mannose-6-phosphate isomerase